MKMGSKHEVGMQNGTMRDIKKQAGYSFSDSETESDSSLPLRQEGSEGERKTKRQKQIENEGAIHQQTISHLKQIFPKGLPSETFSSDSEQDHVDWSQELDIYEPCLFGRFKISLPTKLFRIEDLGQILNLDTWNKELTPEERHYLMQYLPKLPSAAATEENLKALFSKKNFYFGNPIDQLGAKLRGGSCHYVVQKYKERMRHLEKQTFRHNLMVYNSAMLQRCLHFKKKLFESVNVENGQFLISNDEWKLLFSMEKPHQRKSFLLTDESLDESRMGSDTQSGTDSSDSSSSSMDDFGFSRKMKEKSRNRKLRKKLAKYRMESKQLDSDQEDTYEKTSKKYKGGKASRTKGEAERPDTSMAYPVFSAIREFIQNSEDGLTLDELFERFISSEFLMRQVLHPLNAREFLKLTLTFLAAPPSLPSSGSSTIEPVPLVKEEGGRWHWIAPVGGEPVQWLEQLFFFAISRNRDDPNKIIKTCLSRQQKCVSTISPSDPHSVAEFQAQERERYNNPTKSFTYVINGVRCIVAPLRRGAGNPSNRPREHFLLKIDRPPHVNLLCLVRDAASKLPGGCGTRADVALLLKDSQYVVEDATEAQLNSVVSGALDRLHSEEDPCVSHISELKLWIYLHRNRTEEDFDLKSVRKRLKTKKEKSPED